MEIEIRALTFGGFYGGLWDQGENEYNAAQLEEDLDVIQLKDEWGFGVEYRDKVAELYAQKYVDMCNKILDVDFKVIRQCISSPKEYNFETDKIFITVEVGDYEALVDKLIKLANDPKYRAELGNIIHDEHTSCSGFWSLMSNDIEEWFAFMYDPDYDYYTSFFMAYLMFLIDPEAYDGLDNQIYYYVSESTDLHCIRPETTEAEEEYELLQNNRDAYEAFVNGPGEGFFDGYCANSEDWAEYKTDFRYFLEEYNLEQKRKAALAAHPVIPGLFGNDE